MNCTTRAENTLDCCMRPSREDIARLLAQHGIEHNQDDIEALFRVAHGLAMRRPDSSATG